MNISNQSSRKFNKLIVVNGISGSGKTMITSLMDSFIDSTLPFIDYGIEGLLIASHLEKIDRVTANELLIRRLNQKYNDLLIGREINFKISDLTSVFKSQNKLKYFKAALGVNSSPGSNLILLLHQLDFAFNSFNSIYKKDYIEIHCFRHPMYLLEHWKTSVSIYETKKNNFTLFKKDSKSNYPWFIYDSKMIDAYLRGNIIEKATACVISISESALLLSRNTKNRNFVRMPFERTVLDPSKFIETLNSVGLNRTRISDKVMKKQKIPRQYIEDGIVLEIYKKYGATQEFSRTSPSMRLKKLQYAYKSVLNSQLFKRLNEVSDNYLEQFDFVS